MKTMSALLGATAAAAIAVPVLAQIPPAPPAPPAPPSLAAPRAPEVPPLPPLPPAPPMGHRGTEVISRSVDGHQVTIVARRADAARGLGGAHEQLTFTDPDGKEVRVYSDRPITRAEVDRMRADAQAQGERAMAEGQRAMADGRLAREAGEKARAQAFVIRREAMDAASKAIADAHLQARDYASVAPRELRIFRRDGGPDATVWIDGQHGPGFAAGDRPELRALHDEVKALRDELKSLRAELERERRR